MKNKNISEKEIAQKAKLEILIYLNHKLRDLLNNIHGFTQLLNLEDLTPNQHNYVRQIHDNSGSILATVNILFEHCDLLDQTATTLDDEFSLSELIAALASNVVAKAKAKGITEIKVNQPNEFPSLIIGDSHYISQIVNILINNAIRFSSSGTITITLAAIDNQSALPKKIKISVEDEGTGISTTQLQHLFDLFSNPENCYLGAGLRLSLCKQIVTIIGGEIGVIRKNPCGTIFWLTFPYKKPEKPVVSTTTTNGNTPTIKILLVENNPSHQLVQKLLIEKLGYHVDTSSDGYSALQKLKTSCYKVIFTAMLLPDQSGIELTRAIKIQLGDIAPPIIAITTLHSEKDFENFIEAGISDTITKPVDINALKNVLDEYLVYN